MRETTKAIKEVLLAIGPEDEKIKKILEANGYLVENAENIKPEDQIEIVWDIEDVKSIVSDEFDLSDNAARFILERLDHNHDACYGICWDTIETTLSDQLYDIRRLGPGKPGEFGFDTPIMDEETAAGILDKLCEGFEDGAKCLDPELMKFLVAEWVAHKDDPEDEDEDDEEEQTRRDEKNGLYPDKEDPCN